MRAGMIVLVSPVLRYPLRRRAAARRKPSGLNASEPVPTEQQSTSHAGDDGHAPRSLYALAQAAAARPRPHRREVETAQRFAANVLGNSGERRSIASLRGPGTDNTRDQDGARGHSGSRYTNRD